MSETPRSDAVMCCDDFESLCYKLEKELDHAIRGRDQGLDFILAMRADVAADSARLERLLDGQLIGIEVGPDYTEWPTTREQLDVHLEETTNG